MGLEAFDPVQLPNPGRGGHGGLSLSGAPQFAMGGSPDPGKRRTSTGLSLDDPDGDGVVSELIAGDVDAAEFALLNSPVPAVLSTDETESGRVILREIGCVRCHVETWKIEARDATIGLGGDRRHFHIRTASRYGADGRPSLYAVLEPLVRHSPGGGVEPRCGSFIVERIYSDFKHWDIGNEFYERRFDGSSAARASYGSTLGGRFNRALWS